MNCMKQGRCAAALLALSVLVTACSPALTRHRVDIWVRKDGSCSVGQQPAECSDAGRMAARQYGAEEVSAVLSFEPEAPQVSRTAARESLQKAHVIHVQYGEQVFGGEAPGSAPAR